MPHPRPNRLLTFFLLLPLLAVPVAAGAEEIHAKLIGYQEVPSVSTVARGEFRAEISRDGSAIDWELSFSGLQAPLTQAHIHFGQRSVIRGIVIWLCQTATSLAPLAARRRPLSRGRRRRTFRHRILRDVPAALALRVRRCYARARCSTR